MHLSLEAPRGGGLGPCFTPPHRDAAAPSCDLVRDRHYQKSRDPGVGKLLFPLEGWERKGRNGERNPSQERSVMSPFL